MREVVERRHRRVQDEQKRLPDLIVIDGGRRGQVQAAVEAFNGLEYLTATHHRSRKKEESIVFPDARKDLQLPRSDDALRLLQRLRDEAHRCANSFNANLEASELESLCSMICQDLAQHADIIC